MIGVIRTTHLVLAGTEPMAVQDVNSVDSTHGGQYELLGQTQA